MGEKPRFWVAICVLLSLFGLCAVVAVTMTVKANAETFVCAEYKGVQKALADHHEEPIGGGMTESGNAALVLFASPDGNWTLLAADAAGNACIVGVGSGWTNAPQVKDEAK